MCDDLKVCPLRFTPSKSFTRVGHFVQCSFNKRVFLRKEYLFAILKEQAFFSGQGSFVLKVLKVGFADEGDDSHFWLNHAFQRGHFPWHGDARFDDIHVPFSVLE